VYGAEQDTNSSDRLADSSALRVAIAAGDLRLQYQPKVDLRTCRVCGVEALVRWSHPQRGLVPPDQFIGLAEQTGLMGALTRWVLEAALRQAQAWQGAGCAFLPVAVNLSMASLQDPHLPELIAGLLERYAVPATALRLEVTESMVMADTARTQHILARVTALGVAISIDDYGTGYSSLAYLKRLPIDELKIDRVFVRQMTAEATDAVIVRSTVELGHNLGLRVVAEGVETRAAWEMLAEMGCDAAQGYYLARPLPASGGCARRHGARHEACCSCWLTTTCGRRACTGAPGLVKHWLPCAPSCLMTSGTPTGMTAASSHSRQPSCIPALLRAYQDDVQVIEGRGPSVR